MSSRMPPSRSLALPTAARVQRPSVWAQLLQRLAVALSRRDLAVLDDRLLDDIGLTRAAALAEAERGYSDRDAD